MELVPPSLIYATPPITGILGSYWQGVVHTWHGCWWLSYSLVNPFFAVDSLAEMAKHTIIFNPFLSFHLNFPLPAKFTSVLPSSTWPLCNHFCALSTNASSELSSLHAPACCSHDIPCMSSSLCVPPSRSM